MAVTKEQAIEIARQDIKEVVSLQAGSPIRVEQSKDCWVVTFVHVLPPGTRGPDYDAQVTVDRTTGAVVKILVAS